MNANPRYIEHGLGDYNPPDDSEREAAIERRTEALIAEMWQDPEYLSDAMSDAAVTIGWYRKGRVCHPDAVRWLTMLRDGSDDMELARMLRESVRDAISDAASDRAEKEFGV
jgi:hypothetical protein